MIIRDLVQTWDVLALITPLHNPASRTLLQYHAGAVRPLLPMLVDYPCTHYELQSLNILQGIHFARALKYYCLDGVLLLPAAKNAGGAFVLHRRREQEEGPRINEK